MSRRGLSHNRVGVSFFTVELVLRASNSSVSPEYQSVSWVNFDLLLGPTASCGSCGTPYPCGFSWGHIRLPPWVPSFHHCVSEFPACSRTWPQVRTSPTPVSTVPVYLWAYQVSAWVSSLGLQVTLGMTEESLRESIVSCQKESRDWT